MMLCPTIDTFIIDPLPLGSYTFHYWPGYDTIPPTCSAPVDTGGNPIPYPWAIETITFSVAPVGLSETSANDGITIYPNPSAGKFTVQGATAEIQVYDLFGRLLLRSNKPEIDMSSYPAGVYIWQVGTERGKVIIE